MVRSLVERTAPLMGYGDEVSFFGPVAGMDSHSLHQRIDKRRCRPCLLSIEPAPQLFPEQRLERPPPGGDLSYQVEMIGVGGQHARIEHASDLSAGFDEPSRRSTEEFAHRVFKRSALVHEGEISPFTSRHVEVEGFAEQRLLVPEGGIKAGCRDAQLRRQLLEGNALEPMSPE